MNDLHKVAALMAASACFGLPQSAEPVEWDDYVFAAGSDRSRPRKRKSAAVLKRRKANKAARKARRA